MPRFLHRRKKNAIPLVSLARSYCLIVYIFIRFLQYNVWKFLYLYRVICGELTENASRVLSSWLVKVTPPAWLCQRTPKLVRAWHSNLDIFINCPFSDVVTKSSSIRISVLNDDKKSSRSYFGPESLDINWHLSCLNLANNITSINQIHVFNNPRQLPKCFIVLNVEILSEKLGKFKHFGIGLDIEYFFGFLLLKYISIRIGSWRESWPKVQHGVRLKLRILIPYFSQDSDCCRKCPRNSPKQITDNSVLSVTDFNTNRLLIFWRYLLLLWLKWSLFAIEMNLLNLLLSWQLSLQPSKWLHLRVVNFIFLIHCVH